MMNSTNSISLEEIFSLLGQLFEGVSIEKVDPRQYKLITPPEKTIPVLEFLKEKGYSHLSILTCIDWIAEKKFELLYILFNWGTGVTLLVSTYVNRDNPIFYTVKHIWPTAEYYERDVHEFFGVKFEGNENCEKPLILELWNDLPPLRKDFDPLEYSKKHYPDRDYKKDAIHEARIIRGDVRGEIDG